MKPNSFLNKVIYQVFVRDFSPEGTFKKVTEKIPEIRALGVDILYLMPIQPLGKVGRKGTIGSPYAIQDYTKINPDMGTEADLIELIQATHKAGMQIITDQVFNHTSRDSWLLANHPEWFYHDKNGNPCNKAGDWADVYDLDHSHPELEDYLAETLRHWVNLGIDGFRFDVASLIPASFFKLARQKLGDGPLFLAECIDTGFLLGTRADGFYAASNGELAANGFDLFYNYPSFRFFQDYMKSRKESDLARYRVALTMEESAIPEECAIVRALENHDQPRLASYSKSEQLRQNLLAFTFFTRGPVFTYNGEEVEAEATPSLFEIEPIDFTIKNREYFDLFKKLCEIKHREKNNHCLVSLYPEHAGRILTVVNVFDDSTKEYGLFNLTEEAEELPEDVVPAGIYTDLISGKKVEVKAGEKLVVASPLYLA